MELEEKPEPSASPETASFWEACRRGQFTVQRCRSCGRVQGYYRRFCAHCWSDDVEDVPSTGRGKIYTYTVVFENHTRGFRAQVPYVLAVVELDEGVRVLGNVVNCKPDTVRVGMVVEVTFERRGDFSVPVFQPADLHRLRGGRTPRP